MITLHEFLFQDYYDPDLLLDYIVIACKGQKVPMKGLTPDSYLRKNETKDYIAELSDLIEWCEREDINPKMFVDAQLIKLLPYFKENGIPFTKGQLTSVKATQRYNNFRDDFGKKERCFDATILLPEDQAEQLYMLDYVYPKLMGQKPKSKEVKRDIKQRGLVYVEELVDYRHLLTRIKALVDLLNLIDQRLVTYIHLCKRSFTWSDVITFMRGYVV